MKKKSVCCERFLKKKRKACKSCPLGKKKRRKLLAKLKK